MSLFRWLTARLSRVTSSRALIPQIDGLRFIAIAAVVLYHLNDSLVAKLPQLEAAARQTTLFAMLKVGHLGVPLFFSISGFILSLPFLEAVGSGKSISLKHYLLRRVTRLEPPYVVNLLLVFLLLVFVRQMSVEELWQPLLASMFYLHNQIYGEMSRINFVAWSLEIEVQFYLLAPLLCALYLRGQPVIRRASLGAVILLAIVAQSTTEDVASPRIKLSLLWHLDHFLLGILAADLFSSARHAQQSRSWGWDVFGWVTLCGAIAAERSATWAPTTSVLLAGLFVAAFRGQLTPRVLSWTPLTIVGGMCYTIYLYHFYVISLTGKLLFARLATCDYPAAILWASVATLPLILLFSAVMFACVERPFMAWRPWGQSPIPPGKPSATFPPAEVMS